MARVLIGTSSWHYNSWPGPFFPKKLSATYWKGREEGEVEL